MTEPTEPTEVADAADAAEVAEQPADHVHAPVERVATARGVAAWLALVVLLGALDGLPGTSAALVVGVCPSRPPGPTGSPSRSSARPAARTPWA